MSDRSKQWEEYTDPGGWGWIAGPLTDEARRVARTAPDLLAACEAVMAHSETLPDPPPYYQNLCIVTAQARGEFDFTAVTLDAERIAQLERELATAERQIRGLVYSP